MLTTPLFGESTTAWQFFSIFTRWLTSLALWWSLMGLWPRQPKQAFWASALFAVYPGFGQQYIAVTYSNAYLVFSLFILSFGAMIWAIRSQRIENIRRWSLPLMVLSLLGSAFSMFITEYFLGLELLRPFLLWVLLGEEYENRKQRLSQVALRWAPYLAILIPFIAWRAFYTPSPRAQIVLLEGLLKTPLATLLALGRTIIQDFVELNFLGWFHDLDLAYLNDFDQNVIVTLAGAVLLSAALTIFYLLRLKNSRPAVNDTEQATPFSWARQAIGLGIAATLVSGWTIWITDLHFELLFPYDRFALITMLGTALLIAGLIGLLDRKSFIGAILVGVLVGVSAGIQFQHRLAYRQEWLSQKTFFWQLLWRAPGIQPGTAVMTSEIPFTYYSDNSLTAPLNWIYAPDNKSQQMDYLLYDIEARLGENFSGLEPGMTIDMPYRTAEFQGSTSQAIVLFYDPPRCLKVMNPALDRFLPVKPLYIREATPLSRLDLILPQPASPAAPPLNILGQEPAHAWCYYFEKAELYAQTGDWEKVAEMADSALKITKHFTDKNVSELIPFAMGYAHTGKWEKAVELSLNAYQIWDKTQYPLCDAWQSIRLGTAESEAKQKALKEVQEVLTCVFP
jgi:hypothetical protein